MSRFSISLLCEQVYNICRLCGVDNPDKIPIIGAEDMVFNVELGEPTLAKKIELCVGIKVALDDKMPQKICSLCVDKMNDFYEYRAMCENTDVQTRKFLHLPVEQPVPLLVPKIEPEITAVIMLDDDEDVKPNIKRGPKTRNRKKQTESEEPGNSEEVDSKPLLDAPSEKRAKYEFPCQYCKETYSQNTELDRHLVVKHTPLVHKFGCGSCMEYFDTATEFKDHNLWHKLTRTSFCCFRCGKKFAHINTLNKHVSLNGCIRQPRVSREVILVPDMQCPVCHKVFKTRNLYEWHGCFIRSRTNCPKCGKHFVKKNLLLRHFMLYCSGTMPFLDPIVIPKDEPGSGSVNGQQQGSLPGSSGTEVKRRGRPKTRVTESMKEETIDLPLPPMLDLPDLKSEFNSNLDGHNSSEAILSGTETGQTPKRSSLIEETVKITTLLRSGESVDGNTDINTINSMLSSVNEAIATISKVRKKKKKRGRLSSSGAGNAGEASEKSNLPMVVLSKANVKQEVHEDSSMFAALIENSAGVENGLNAAANIDQQQAEGAESDHEDHNNAAESFAHHNDDGGDSDSDVEIISVEQYQPVGSAPVFATNWTQQIELQVKQEPMATDDGDESDFEGYEDASMFVAVKQEPTEEAVETAPIEQCAPAKKEPEGSFSTYQALRIKIKKEKGLLNASVVGEVEESVPADPISTPEGNAEALPTDKRQSREHVKAKKTTKPSTKRNNNPPPVKRCLRTSTTGLNVSIKQEPMEADEELQESVTDPEHDYPPEETFIDTTVRIKQEPQENDTRPGRASETHPDDEVVTFDGKRIKRERPDDDPESHKRHASSNDAYRKTLNPLSLSGVRIATGKKFANSQPGISANKSSVMINPFALLKQKESVPTVSEKDSASKGSTTDSLTGQSERFGLPVISQVQSIDPVQHLSLTRVDTAAAESTPVIEQQQQEPTVEATNQNDDTNNMSHADSSPSFGPSGSEPVASVASNASPQENVSELQITSVTTISEDIAPPQENVSELKIASVTTVPEDIVPPQENVSELKITSATTTPDDILPPQENVCELKILSVSTISEDIVRPHEPATELKITTGKTISEDIVPPQEPATEVKITSGITDPEDILPPQESSTELKIASVTTIPEDLAPVQKYTSELRISNVSTIPEDMEKGFHSQSRCNEQQRSADDVTVGDANAIPSSDASEQHDLEDLTPEVSNDAETSCGPAVEDPTEAVDARPDDGNRTVDGHGDDDQKTLNNEVEQVDSVASESGREEMPEDTVAASTDDEPQEPNKHDTVTAVATDNGDTTAEAQEVDFNISTANSSEQQKEPSSDESSLDGVHAGSQKDFCAIASNDEGLVVKQ